MSTVQFYCEVTDGAVTLVNCWVDSRRVEWPNNLSPSESAAITAAVGRLTEPPLPPPPPKEGAKK